VKIGDLDVVRVPAAPGLFVYAAADPDALLDRLDEATFAATDERMPYFSLLWPAGEALAGHVLGQPLRGRDVLDLGSGVGAAGLAALVAGARVTFLDWEPRALLLVEAAAREQGLVPAGLVVADWRRPPPLPPFDVVLGADLCYEERNVVPLAGFLAGHLAVGGEAWLADPGRRFVEGLSAAVHDAGLEVLSRAPLPSPAGASVTLWRVARAGSAPGTVAP
jgi:predicted nicotinamide N-methyase